MNNFEKIIYNIVKKNAPLKDKLVKSYQRIFSIFGLLQGRIKTNLSYEAFEDNYFGFHDKPSINHTGLMLCHKNYRNFKNGIGKASIGYIDINDSNKHFNELIKTNCCNYQQGSMAAWFDDEHVILNNYSNNRNVCQLIDLQGNIKKTWDFHYFSISASSLFISTISYARFGRGLKGYGYNVNISPEEAMLCDELIPNDKESDFVIINTKNNNEIFRLSISDALKESNHLLSDGYNYFSHSKFSPNSSYVYFMLRSSDDKVNTSQLFTLKLKDNTLSTVSTGGMVSHLDWLSDDKIVVFCNDENKNDGYYIVDVNTHTMNHLSVKELSSDGHPTSLNNHTFFTDTYPNRNRIQKLYRVDILNNTCETIASFYSPMKYRGVERVDLHPRVSACKKYLTVDTSYLNKRSQIVFTL